MGRQPKIPHDLAVRRDIGRAHAAGLVAEGQREQLEAERRPKDGPRTFDPRAAIERARRIRAGIQE